MNPCANPNPDPEILVLPVPRWPFLWPVLLLPTYALNPALHVARSWGGSPTHRVFGILIFFAALFGGSVISMNLLASQYWRELRIGGGRLRIRPAVHLPQWFIGCLGSHLARLFRDGQMEIPLEQASLEWVGKTLLLHGHPEMDVRLGRGRRAERIAQWLIAHGLSRPVGR